MLAGALGLFLFVTMLMMIYILEKDESEYSKSELTLFLLVLFIIGIGLAYAGEQYGYKKGQVDALEGNTKYKLKTKVDSTWVRKNNGE